MSLFVLDNTGNKSLLNESITHKENLNSVVLKEQNHEETYSSDKDEENEENNDYWGLPPPHVDISHIIRETLAVTVPPKTENEIEREKALEMLNLAKEAANSKKHHRQSHRIEKVTLPEMNPITGKIEDELLKTDVEKEMDKCVLNGIEKHTELPKPSKKKQQKLKQMERSKTKGPGWFDLPATEITEEVENDLKILQMRSALDPKHFYKKNDLKVLPKYFQIGTVLPSPLDYYNERGTRKNKKRSLVDELMADAEFQKYTKRKYNEVMARNEKYSHRKAMKKMKKLKKNK